MKTLLVGDRLGGVLFDVQKCRDGMETAGFESWEKDQRQTIIGIIGYLVRMVEDMDQIDLDETKAVQDKEPEIQVPNNPRIVPCSHTSKRTYLLASPFYGQSVSWCINCGAFGIDGTWTLPERPANNPRIVRFAEEFFHVMRDDASLLCGSNERGRGAVNINASQAKFDEVTCPACIQVVSVFGRRA